MNAERYDKLKRWVGGICVAYAWISWATVFALYTWSWHTGNRSVLKYNLPILVFSLVPYLLIYNHIFFVLFVREPADPQSTKVEKTSDMEKDTEDSVSPE